MTLRGWEEEEYRAGSKEDDMNMPVEARGSAYRRPGGELGRGALEVMPVLPDEDQIAGIIAGQDPGDEQRAHGARAGRRAINCQPTRRECCIKKFVKTFRRHKRIRSLTIFWILFGIPIAVKKNIRLYGASREAHLSRTASFGSRSEEPPGDWESMSRRRGAHRVCR